MSFDYRGDAGKSTATQTSADRAATPGKHTLTSLVDLSSNASSTGKAEYGATDVRAASIAWPRVPTSA